MAPFLRFLIPYLMFRYWNALVCGLILLAACHDKPKNLADTSSEPITASAKPFIIDTLAILTNKNLEKLLIQIEQDSLVESKKTSAIPPVIQSFLNQHGASILADYGQPFNATDNILEERPNRQLLYLGVGNHTIIMAYYLGGFSLSERVLLFEITENHITDFWTGYLQQDALDKQQVIRVLRDNKDKRWGVNTNALYL